MMSAPHPLYLQKAARAEHLTSLLSGHSFHVLPKLFPVTFHREFRQKAPSGHHDAFGHVRFAPESGHGTDMPDVANSGHWCSAAKLPVP
jgi:hypothetical protein